MEEKKSYQARTISDKFWEAIKEEIAKKERGPGKKYKNVPGQGRKPVPALPALLLLGVNLFGFIVNFGIGSKYVIKTYFQPY